MSLQRKQKTKTKEKKKKKKKVRWTAAQSAGITDTIRHTGRVMNYQQPALS